MIDRPVDKTAETQEYIGMAEKMRRSDREITDQKEIEGFILGETILRVAFYDKGEIYIVPVNYGCLMEGGKILFYFHGACAGRKFELAGAEPSVGFEIDGRYKLLEGKNVCSFSAEFQSVIGTGRLCLVEDRREKKMGLDAVMRQATGKAEWDYDDRMLERTAVFRLEVEKMSCKAKLS